MKISIRNLGLVALVGMASPSMALFTNGGFEQGNFTGWSLRWGKTTRGEWASVNDWQSKVTWYDSINWKNQTVPGNELHPGTDPNPSNSYYAGPLYLHGGVVNWNYPDAIYPALMTAPAPIAGTTNLKKAMLNVRPSVQDDQHLLGQYDVTQILQVDTVRAADFKNGKYTAYVYWASVLTDPEFDHSKAEQPFVSVTIAAYKPGAATPYKQYKEFYTTDLGPVGGWNVVPKRTVEYFKQKIDSLTQLALGDIVKVEVVTGDCGRGGHGGYTYLDNVGAIKPDTLVIDTLAPACLYSKESVVIGENSVINSTVSSSGAIITQKGAKVYGDVLSTGVALYNNWQKPLAFGTNAYVSGVAKTALSSYYTEPGVVVVGGVQTNWTKSFPVIPTVNVVVDLSKNPSVSAGGMLPLAPGRYGQLSSNGNTTQRATLKLVTGVYEFDKFYTTATDILLDVSNGPIYINVKSDLGLNAGTKMTKLNGTINDLPATDVSWYANAKFGIGPNSELKGQFVAPNAEQWTTVFGTNSKVTGSVKAKYIQFSTGTTFTCQLP